MTTRIMLLLVLCCMSQALAAQYVYTIKADSVKITNNCDTAELILENHTQNVPGFLFNKGRGRTEFKRGLVALDDSLYLIGGDTLNLNKGRTNITVSNGLTYADGNVKLGGTLTDFITPLQFDLTQSGFGIFSIYSAGGNSWFQVVNSADNDIVVSGLCQNGVDWSEYSLNKDGFVTYSQLTTESSFSSSRYYAGPNGIALDGGDVLMNGKISIGGAVQDFTPTARVQIAAGSATAGTAPIKLTAGTLLTTPENGALEFDGTDLYLTENTTRYKLSKIVGGQITTSFGAPSLSAYNSVTTTLSVTGAQPGDVVTVSANTGAANPASIIITAYVTTANTVILQAYNASNSAVTLASDTYKVKIVK